MDILRRIVGFLKFIILHLEEWEGPKTDKTF